jgi:hypothetical protein
VRNPAPFGFQDLEGKQAKVFSDKPVPSTGGISLEGQGGLYQTPFFSLERSTRITEGGKAFALEYETQGPGEGLQIVLSSGTDKTLKTSPLPSGGGLHTRYEIALPAESELAGFRIQAKSPRTIRILAAALSDQKDRIEYDGVTLVQTEGLQVTSRLTEKTGAVSFQLDRALQGRASGFSLRLKTTGDSALIRLTGPEEAETGARELVLAPAAQDFTFTAGSVGFYPQSARLRISGGEISTLSVRTVPDPSTVDPAVPIPSDPGSILEYDRAAWRSSRYELFSWGAFPNVLIFDFADYATQALYFGRLGFFVAVRGEAGRIEPQEHYSGRHVYNAHDYRPEALSQFFELARTSGAALNAQERSLKDICVRNGLLVEKQDGSVSPGSGAIASVSRETTPFWVRKVLLTHELSHGLFYVVPGYREKCMALWQELPESQRSFITLFLGNKGSLDGRAGYEGYDTTNTYLMVNEMQAHVMQQDRSEVDGYIRRYDDRMRSLLPQERALIDAIASDSTAFSRIWSRLAEAQSETAGIANGDYFTVKKTGL